MLDINKLKLEMENEYQECVRRMDRLEGKYMEDGRYLLDVSKMTIEDRIEYVKNRTLRYRLYHYLDKHINPNILVKCKECGKEYGSNKGYDEFCGRKCYSRNVNKDFE